MACERIILRQDNVDTRIHNTFNSRNRLCDILRKGVHEAYTLLARRRYHTCLLEHFANSLMGSTWQSRLLKQINCLCEPGLHDRDVPRAFLSRRLVALDPGVQQRCHHKIRLSLLKSRMQRSLLVTPSQQHRRSQDRYSAFHQILLSMPISLTISN